MNAAAQLEIDHRQVEGGLGGNLRIGVRFLVLHGQLAQRDDAKAGNNDHVPKDIPRDSSRHLVDQ